MVVVVFPQFEYFISMNFVFPVSMVGLCCHRFWTDIQITIFYKCTFSIWDFI